MVTRRPEHSEQSGCILAHGPSPLENHLSWGRRPRQVAGKAHNGLGTHPLSGSLENHLLCGRPVHKIVRKAHNGLGTPPVSGYHERDRSPMTASRSHGPRAAWRALRSTAGLQARPPRHRQLRGRHEGRTKGFFVAFDYSDDALCKISAFFRKTGKVIVALTVPEILDEQLTKKLAQPCRSPCRQPYSPHVFPLLAHCPRAVRERNGAPSRVHGILAARWARRRRMDDRVPPR